jgi:hypothetical protein
LKFGYLKFYCLEYHFYSEDLDFAILPLEPKFGTVPIQLGLHLHIFISSLLSVLIEDHEFQYCRPIIAGREERTREKLEEREGRVRGMTK